MKKLTMISMAAVLSLSLVAVGCAKKETAPTPAATTGGAATATPAAGGKPVTIKMFQFKVEIADQLGKLIQEYQKLNPNVKIQVDTVGGGADYGAALLAKFNSGDKPDIFNNGGFSDMDKWIRKPGRSFRSTMG